MERCIVVKYITRKFVQDKYKDCISDNKDKIDVYFVVYHIPLKYDNGDDPKIFVKNEIDKTLANVTNYGASQKIVENYEVIYDMTATSYNSIYDDIEYYMITNMYKDIHIKNDDILLTDCKQVIDIVYDGYTFKESCSHFIQGNKKEHSNNINDKCIIHEYMLHDLDKIKYKKNIYKNFEL